MVISAPRALMLIICITYASIADSYVVINDNSTTSDDGVFYDDDDPFTVHHVDEVHRKYEVEMQGCAIKQNLCRQL